ncbi:sulfotransferase family 2 domain-containing protein [Ruegeria sp. R13_0]|uniref:sulfotransferase family 2 domain-containing protein n=1 Tax=Ruegeria sp. R13_0 TaxID=2821099 RepID=UPI001ADA47F7|nr:sulfotransferase family 2 domain-containing protein [Ruegeria sp. R13_0]MBO9436728.1 sulfotransferase family 2 domain-containing protein [Ruegeria sp. R13_0]
MPVISTPKGQLFFAHVPKTGGSSVEEYLKRRFGGRLSLIDHNKREGIVGTGLISPATHLTAIDLAELIPDVIYSFAVVRDPLTRLQSEYRFQTGASRMSRFGFSTWLRIVVAACNLDARIYHNHIRPQSDLVPKEAETFHFEDGFDTIIGRLDEVTETTAPTEKMGHLLKRTREPITLTVEDVNLIADFFAVDYERFGYKRPTTAGLKRDPHAGLRTALAKPLARAVVAKQRHDWLR